MADFLPESTNACPTSPTTDQPELLPCPFCGGGAKRFTIEEEGDNFGGDVIACTGICGASSHVEFGRKENLVSLWNTRLTSTTPTLGDMAQEQRLRMFLEILSASCGQADAGDHRWNWINAFCSEHEGREPDTFNLAEQRGYTTVSHNTDTDEGMVYLTDAGRAYLAAAPASPIPTATGDMGKARLALEAIKVVTATTKDAVAGLSRIMAITRSAGVDAPYSDLMAKPDVALIVNRPRGGWRHLFERADACTIPPEGWTCSRAPGHDGPCAASPIPTSVNGAGERTDAHLLRLIAQDHARLAPNAYHSAATLCQIADRLDAAALSPALDNTAVEGRFYALPFAFHEAPDSGAAYIRDANGQAVAMMMWPGHTIEDEDAAVAETYAIGRAFAAALTAETEKA